METAWVIESENGCFIGESKTLVSPHLQWVGGHENAIRFARKQDAEAVERICRNQGIGFHEDAHCVNEHAWYTDNDLAVCAGCGDPYLLNSDLINGICAACAASPALIEFDEEGE